MRTLFIMRSRFQPFTKYHYEAIRDLILQNQASFKAGALLVMAVVRDYETLIRSRDEVNGITVDADDLRHLPLFNPFSLVEVVSDIKESIMHYANVQDDDLSTDALKKSVKSSTVNGDDEKFLRSVLSTKVVIWPLHVKFSDLADVLTEQVAFPRGMEPFLPHNGETYFKSAVNGKVDEVAFKAAIDWLRSHPLLAITSYSACDILQTTGSEKCERVWYFPLLDEEDINDCENALKSLVPKGDKVAMGIFEEAPKENVQTNDHWAGDLGIYGIFAVHAFVSLQDRRQKKLLPDVAHLLRHMEKCVTKDSFLRYKQGLETKIGQTMARMDKTSWERAFFEDSGKFFLHVKNTLAAAPPGKIQWLQAKQHPDHPRVKIGNGITRIAYGKAREHLLDKRNQFAGWLNLAKKSDKPYNGYIDVLQTVERILNALDNATKEPPNWKVADTELLVRLTACNSVQELGNTNGFNDEMREIESRLGGK